MGRNTYSTIPDAAHCCSEWPHTHTAAGIGVNIYILIKFTVEKKALQWVATCVRREQDCQYAMNVAGDGKKADVYTNTRAQAHAHMHTCT